jgi:hypothetical protein
MSWRDRGKIRLATACWLHPQLKKQTRQLATATVGQAIQLKKQTLQLATATVDQDIQLKQQTPQLATATLDKIQLK